MANQKHLQKFLRRASTPLFFLLGRSRGLRRRRVREVGNAQHSRLSHRAPVYPPFSLSHACGDASRGCTSPRCRRATSRALCIRLGGCFARRKSKDHSRPASARLANQDRRGNLTKSHNVMLIAPPTGTTPPVLLRNPETPFFDPYNHE